MRHKLPIGFQIIATLCLLTLGTCGAQDSKQSIRNSETPELNRNLIAFCQENLGKKVGNGQCSDLLATAFKTIGAKQPREFTPPSMVNDDYVWGTPINPRSETILPGDVIQFRNVVIEPHSSGTTHTWIYTHHTAVVFKVHENHRYEILHQNVGHGTEHLKHTVQRTGLLLSHMTEGIVWFYRPVPLEVSRNEPLPTVTRLPNVATHIPELNARMLAFCEDNQGSKVGNGQCTDFVLVAFQNIGAKLPREFPTPKPPLMEGDYVWGTLIDPKTDPVFSGDILQFRNVVISIRSEIRLPESTSNSTETWNFPHHTAVIGKVKDNQSYEIFHQNVGKVTDPQTQKQLVQRANLDLRSVTQGDVRLYRPIAKEIAIDLNPNKLALGDSVQQTTELSIKPSDTLKDPQTATPFRAASSPNPPTRVPVRTPEHMESDPYSRRRNNNKGLPRTREELVYCILVGVIICVGEFAADWRGVRHGRGRRK